ncbi:hypothetical protein BO70DRAFT_425249 [Aspergillus heteromorphus CBS 117.55]|uniref:DNA replication factor Cdt1 C-terminal domain-containing protein n=1 Tax=Aspergillus heteromorphus CBS 117.55 TaxID=1448321 RepID=A0A317X7J2_9EURO|nr:uncharacterized protein BO70DRAFT_425249 [Aspergillus heteromorphus CBS 117.55]PWY92570.1 hypothetical protein BO70DRAFT_425249 [Aspergillus heteromorphus CBS 117.55]
MSKNPTTLYLGLAALGAGGYYLYRAGGDPEVAGDKIRHDAHAARLKIPTGDEAEKAGEKAGYEARLNVDEAINNARSNVNDGANRLEKEAKSGVNRLEQIGRDTSAELKSGAEKIEGKIEDKASEAKGTLSAIQSFARAIKPGVATRKSLSELKKPSTAPVPAVTALPVSPSKKRKLHELENVDCASPHASPVKNEESTSSGIGFEAVTPSKTLRLGELALNTPRSGHYARRNSSSALSPPVSPSKRAATARKAVLPARTRPACIDDLVNLHSAFVKAAALHAMHNGLTAPADLREFLPTVERLWRKRKVVVRDLQRLVWVLDQEATAAAAASGLAMPGFRISNYGLGRVCLERVVRDGEGRITETEWQERFEQSLDVRWEKAVDAADGDESRVDFLATLGTAVVHESLTPFTSFRKGQQRLQDLKGGVIKMKTERMRTEAKDETPEKPVDAASTRRKGLLDRIKEKQLRQAKLPPPPSKDMLLRRAAAERVEEVAGVLALLRPAGYVGTGAKAVMTAQRTPFRLEMIAQNVRDSVRSPISEREVEICVEILAREDIAGQWVNFVTVNRMKSVVLKSCADVQTKEIAAKVAQLKVGWEGSEALPVLVEGSA